MLGVKRFGGQVVGAGEVIIRQNGTKFKPGQNVGLGRDYTIYSMIPGKVVFEQYSRTQKQVSVYAVEGEK
jgi:large subunit ribosomal protein L27